MGKKKKKDQTRKHSTSRCYLNPMPVEVGAHNSGRLTTTLKPLKVVYATHISSYLSTCQPGPSLPAALPSKPARPSMYAARMHGRMYVCNEAEVSRS